MMMMMNRLILSSCPSRLLFSSSPLSSAAVVCCNAYSKRFLTSNSIIKNFRNKNLKTLSSSRGFSTNASGAKKKKEDEGKGKKLGKFQKLKKMWKDYGMVFVGYYGTTWVLGYIPCYLALEYGGVNGVEFLEWLGVGEHIDISNWSPQFINMILAYEMNELLDFVRIPVVIATTPTLSRYLKK